MDWDKEFGLLDLLDLIIIRFVFIIINKNKRGSFVWGIWYEMFVYVRWRRGIMVSKCI